MYNTQEYINSQSHQFVYNTQEYKNFQSHQFIACIRSIMYIYMVVESDTGSVCVISVDV